MPFQEFHQLRNYDEDEINLLLKARSMDQLPKIGDTVMGDPDSDIGIVMQHGFVGTNIDLSYLANTLSNMGYRVCLPLLPGHGETQQSFKEASHQKWIEKNQEMIELMKKEKPGRKILLMGHSLGGSLSLFNASRRDDIHAIILLATPSRYNWLIRKFGYFMAKITGRLLVPYKQFLFDDQSFHEHAYVKFLQKYYGKVSTYILAEVLRLMDETYQILDKISVPTLIVASTRDKTIPKSSAKDIYGLISSETKEKFMVDNSYHMVMIDNSRELVRDKIVKFLWEIL